MALVMTTDFFPPVVDDPYDFGRIAAANSLSDIYAMGAAPIAALNIVGFPEKADRAILERILQGGNETALQAGVPIIGGHTVKTPEPLYGLAVTGRINPNKIISKHGARPGDVIILTKPIGSGIITTALKKELWDEDRARDCIDTMAVLNKAGSELIQKIGVNAATDITGFGLMGHLYEMADQSNVTINIDYNSVPVFDGAYELAKEGVYPGGTKSNFEFVKPCSHYEADVVFEEMIILCDAQTSGGLAVSIPRRKYKRLLDGLRPHYPHVRMIGEVTERSDWHLLVQKK